MSEGILLDDKITSIGDGAAYSIITGEPDRAPAIEGI